MSIKFGEYGILARVADGERIQHFADTLASMFDGGLLIVDHQGPLPMLAITDVGRAYLKANKKPDFPASRQYDKDPVMCAVCKINKTLATCACCRERLLKANTNPDDERWFFNQCVGKIRFPRQDSAERAAVDMAMKKMKSGSLKTFDVYECPWCEGWHIGGKYIPSQVDTSSNV